MAYIGNPPVSGNFQVCDAISVVNGQAAYTMQVSSANVSPESANHMLVSLNGVLQKPGSSFTISGSTITFASNLATGDVIDFILLLGNVNDIGVPSDDTVSTAKISANAVTGAKLNTDVISAQTALATAPADTDEFLVSDAGVLKRIDYSLIKGGGMYELIQTQTISSAVSSVDFTSTQMTTDYIDYLVIGTNIKPSSGGETIFVRISSDGGSSYISSANYDYGGHGENSNGDRSTRKGAGDTTFRIMNSGIASSTGSTGSLRFECFDPLNQLGDDKFFNCLYRSVSRNNSGYAENCSGGGMYDGSGDEDTVFNGLRILASSGNLASGTFSIYGRKTS
jgi:hypothetical protein